MPRYETREPYYRDEFATLYYADARDILPRLGANACDLIVTDPPYGVEFVSNKRAERFAAIEGDTDQKVAGEVLALALKTLSRSRHVYVFGPFKELLDQLPLAAVTELIWDKQVRSGGDLSLPWGKSHEPIHFAVYELSRANREKGYGNLAARVRKDSVLRYQRKTGGSATRHPTEKPVPLLRDLIESSSVAGEAVLDPFAGVGSTLVAATLEGRQSVGIEIEKDYVEIAAARLTAAAALTRQMEVA